ncbi:MAG: Gfo/Idh/MocA family oxidoreductase [Gemmatimonadales bacterium]
MRARLPVGVVGVGALGRHHARHLAQLDEVRLVGVCDTDGARAAAIASEFGTRSFTDLDEMLAQIEAVTVAVPTPAHAEVGIRALERGVPVLMEKPLTDSLAAADAMIAQASARGVQLQVGHIERYNRALRAAEPYLDGPRYIESQRLAPFQPRGTDVAVVLDLMIHDLDLVLHLTGGAEAVEVRASGLSLLSSHLDLANARVEFATGAVALATASRVSRERVRRLRLFQPNGYLSLDLASGAGEFMRVKAGWQPGTGEALSDVVERIVLEAPEADALALELQSFVHAVQGERDVVVRGEEGRSALALALRVADAVRTSRLAAFSAG